MSKSKVAQILVEDLVVKSWESKVTPKIKQLAKLLVKTEGQSPIPPLVKKEGNDSYALLIDSEVAIAAKLAEEEGLERLTVLIPEVDEWQMDDDDQDLTSELTKMANLLNEPPEPQAKIEPEPKVEPKVETKPEPQPKPETKIDELERTIKLMETLKKVKYRELQKKLKAYRKQGKTTIKLNRSKAALYLELKRIEGK
jgi:hypothetical protein